MSTACLNHYNQSLWQLIYYSVDVRLQWRRQDLVRGGMIRGAETETPKGVDWVQNWREIPLPTA